MKLSYKSCLLVLTIICSQNVFAAYTLPIGVPEPSFGLRETVESVYGSADYFTHYIDNTDPQSTDSNNTYGTLATPRKTIPSTLVAGDVVRINAGTYAPPSDRFYVYASGTAAEPIFITGKGAASMPVLTKKIHIPNSQYLIIENLKVESGAGGIGVRPLGVNIINHHIGIRNCEIAGKKIFKSYVSYSAHSPFPSSPVQNIVYYNNTIYDNGIYDSIPEDDTSSFSIQHNAQHIWILNNTAYNSGGDGVILAHAANFSTHHIYIGGNTFYNHRENGIDLKQANDVIISQNTVYGFKSTNTSVGEGIVVHYDPERIWIIGNTVYNTEFGIISTGATDLHIIGNTIYNTKHVGGSYNGNSAYTSGAAIHSRNGDNVHISNNTMYNYDTGIQIATTSTTNIYNNVFSNRNEADGFEILFPINTRTSVVSNNLFYPFINQTRIGWSTSSARNNATLTSDTGQGANSMEGVSPAFVSEGTNNFSLTALSPAINKGRNSYSNQHFNDLYGLSIISVEGSAVDLGSKEYGVILKAPHEVYATN